VIFVFAAHSEKDTGDRQRSARRRVAAGLAGIAALGLTASSCTSSGGPAESHSTGPRPVSASSLAPLHGRYAPTIDPANFVRTVDNRYWPLLPGTHYHYEGVRGSTPQADDEVVLQQTKRIAGVTCTIVRDTVSEHGHAVERTFDWYTQDKQGNVWYMGEDSLELKHGHLVRASDSWQTGVRGAKPGIIMPADPQPGDAYRQEYYPPGQALDQARVLRLDGNITVPYGTFTHVLVTSERSPLEPQTEQKYYAPGIGEVAERVVAGHHEEFQLVRVTH
jgi:hypothetical protein